MPDTPPRVATDPLEAIAVVHAILGDTLAVLKERERFPFTMADLPDLRAALMAAIYDGPIDEQCEDCDKALTRATGWICAKHRERAKRCARWTELLHQMDGRTG